MYVIRANEIFSVLSGVIADTYFQTYFHTLNLVAHINKRKLELGIMYVL